MPDQGGLVSKRHRANTMSWQNGVETTRCRVKTASCQYDAMPKTVWSQHNIMSRRHCVKKKNNQTLCIVIMASCHHGVVPTRHQFQTKSCQHSVVSRRCLVNTTSCQYDIVSKWCCVNKVSCQDDVLSRRRCVKTTVCQHGVAPRRHCSRNGVV